MLTRLEVDGFKNLIDFSIDFGPFTCIAGPNGVGKSNVFDAIRFLSLLADHTITEAALLVRGSGIDSGDIRHLFRMSGTSREETFRMAAEMLIEPSVRDDFGRPAEANSTFLRYEIQVGYEAPTHRGTLGRLILRSETLDYFTEREATALLGFPHGPRFRKAAVVNKRRTKSGYISVHEARDGQVEIIVHQDGGSRGPGQTAPAHTAPRTIVGTSNTSVTPTILAVRREMQSWRFLALEPSAMRKADRFQAEPYLTDNGGHLPATLFRLVTEAEKDGLNAESVYATVANRTAQLAPISGVSIDVDEIRQLLTLEVREGSGIRVPAESLSDGTLRFLTLSVLLSDPESQGLICIEEPENGIHPAKMEEIVRLMKDLAVDPYEPPGPDNPFRQVIVATHSPAFVMLQDESDLLFALDTRIKCGDQPCRTLRCRPLERSWRAEAGEPPVGRATILAYLSTPPGKQLSLPELGP